MKKKAVWTKYQRFSKLMYIVFKNSSTFTTQKANCLTPGYKKKGRSHIPLAKFQDLSRDRSRVSHACNSVGWMDRQTAETKTPRLPHAKTCLDARFKTFFKTWASSKYSASASAHSNQSAICQRFLRNLRFPSVGEPSNTCFVLPRFKRYPP